MIGLYTQNKNIQQTLGQLLAHKGLEPYRANVSYDLIIWLSDDPVPRVNCPVIHSDQISLPLSLAGWEQLFNQYLNTSQIYQNKVFLFEGTSRKITKKGTQEVITLTEKENELVCFLAQKEGHCATKEEVLEAVWQYSPEAQTHTVESHVYSIRQKLMSDADAFIKTQDGSICLV